MLITGPPLVHTRPRSSTQMVWAPSFLPSGKGGGCNLKPCHRDGLAGLKDFLAYGVLVGAVPGGGAMPGEGGIPGGGDAPAGGAGGLAPPAGGIMPAGGAIPGGGAMPGEGGIPGGGDAPAGGV